MATYPSLHTDPVVAVLGATGYVGARLVPRLLGQGFAVRVIARDPSRVASRPWADQVDVRRGDALDRESLDAALEGVDALYYLIHGMADGASFRTLDKEAARNAGAASRAAGVQRIVYLGGLGEAGAELSEHLRSRQETGRALAEAGVPVTEFRAGVIVGSGSLSFEMIRDLVERLPAMICPRWVYTRAQPIGIDDVLAYLVAALDTQGAVGRVVEIGGADVVGYGDMMRIYAQVRGLRRVFLPVPVLTPRLSSYWVHWTTPVSASMARPLIEGLRNEVVVRDDSARRLFPAIEPVSYEVAVRRALAQLESGGVASAWSDALSSAGSQAPATTLGYRQGMFRDMRERVVDASPTAVFRAFTGIGGDRGYPAYHWVWWLRGVADRLLGGVGFRRGRRHPDQLREGDALDFWRVERVRPDRVLRLRAEMKVPGAAWLEFRAKPLPDGKTRLTQTAYFAPKGLGGLLYWQALRPFHGPIFSATARRLAERAEAADRGGDHPLRTVVRGPVIA